MSTMVRNNLSGVLVFTNSNTQDFVEWAAKGDPSGEDIQFVDDSYLDNPKFRRQLNIGTLSVIDENGEEVAQAMTAQQQAWENRSRAKVEVERVDTGRSSAAARCLGPGTGSEEQCVQHVLVPKGNAIPPLCPDHKGLASQFVIASIDTEVTGKDKNDKVTWQRVEVAK